MHIGSKQIAKHWSLNLTPKMTMEKLQLLATSALPSPKKENILQIRNKSKQARLALRYPIGPFSDAIFLVYFHKYVFWYQLTKHALDLMPVFLDGARKSERIPSVSFEEYINKSRSLQWDHAFVDQIKSKKINKSHKWDASKKSFGVGAMHCLIYRYWIQILKKERVVRAPHPTFASWVDMNCLETMFTTDQILGWAITHLKVCHWYIEMSPNATPPHEEVNRLEVEPEFVPPPPCPLQ